MIPNFFLKDTTLLPQSFAQDRRQSLFLLQQWSQWVEEVQRLWQRLSQVPHNQIWKDKLIRILMLHPPKN